jgi:hypothetical protein
VLASLIFHCGDVCLLCPSVVNLSFRPLHAVPKPRAKPSAPRLPAPPSPGAIVDSGFVPVRAKLIDLAAFLDRVERYDVADDFRCAALREAAQVLVDGKPERARRILEKLSDPTTKPEEKSSGKAALGAWQPPSGGAAGRVKVRGKVKGR